MEEKKTPDPIFLRELSIKEIIIKTIGILKEEASLFFLLFFLFFIPVLVFQAIVFRNDLTFSFKTIEDLSHLPLLFFLVENTLYELFFAAIILFIQSHFEKKIFFPAIFFQKILLLFFPFLITFFFLFILMLGGAFLILPALVVAFLGCFALYLVFYEKRWGLDAFIESFRTVRKNWIKTFLLFGILNAYQFFLNFLIEWGVSYFDLQRVELKFFISRLFLYFFMIFPQLFFAIFFFNLRHLIKPKEPLEDTEAL